VGCHVFAGCLTESGETELKKSCSNNVITLSLDVTKQDSVRNAYQFVKEKLPDGKGLWGVMNNAGIFGSVVPPDWQPLEDYKDVAAINVYGLVDVTLMFLPLVKRERGRIVNTASIVGRICVPVLTAYSMSKYGVEAFTDGLRRAMRPFGVKALMIEPGAHDTNLFCRETFERNVNRAWDCLTPEIKQDYGEDFFKFSISAREGILKIGSKNLEKVVDAYEHALLGLFPRARYMVGTDAKYFYYPVQCLPEWLGDLVLEKLTCPVLPAAALK
jgi:NAD(P)-dependent dehydrogenase (short-subunit alcohol dehydrogenase family)